MIQKIKIAIVEDDNSMRDIISNHIYKVIGKDESVEICGFSSAEFFLKAANLGEMFQILFTDIQLTDMNGVELVKEIRKCHPKMEVVFITSYGEYVESYVLEAFQYILKRDMDYRLPRVVNQLIEKVRTQEKQYRIGNNILSSINEQNERIEEMKREKAEANKNNVPTEIEEIADFQTIFDVKT